MMLKTEGVELEKIDESTYCPISGDSELFCPHCEETFTKSEMGNAYENHKRLEAEAKREAALKEAFDKEFVPGYSEFRRISKLLLFVALTFGAGFPVFVFSLTFLDFDMSKSFSFWLAMLIIFILIYGIHLVSFTIFRDKRFKEFKAKIKP